MQAEGDIVRFPREAEEAQVADQGLTPIEGEVHVQRLAVAQDGNTLG